MDALWHSAGWLEKTFIVSMSRWCGGLNTFSEHQQQQNVGLHVARYMLAKLLFVKKSDRSVHRAFKQFCPEMGRTRVLLSWFQQRFEMQCPAAESHTMVTKHARRHSPVTYRAA